MHPDLISRRKNQEVTPNQRGPLPSVGVSHLVCRGHRVDCAVGHVFRRHSLWPVRPKAPQRATLGLSAPRTRAARKAGRAAPRCRFRNCPAETTGRHPRQYGRRTGLRRPTGLGPRGHRAAHRKAGRGGAVTTGLVSVRLPQGPVLGSGGRIGGDHGAPMRAVPCLPAVGGAPTAQGGHTAHQGQRLPEPSRRQHPRWTAQVSELGVCSPLRTMLVPYPPARSGSAAGLPPTRSLGNALLAAWGQSGASPHLSSPRPSSLAVCPTRPQLCLLASARPGGQLRLQVPREPQALPPAPRTQSAEPRLGRGREALPSPARA